MKLNDDPFCSLEKQIWFKKALHSFVVTDYVRTFRVILKKRSITEQKTRKKGQKGSTTDCEKYSSFGVCFGRCTQKSSPILCKKTLFNGKKTRQVISVINEKLRMPWHAIQGFVLNWRKKMWNLIFCDRILRPEHNFN